MPSADPAPPTRPGPPARPVPPARPGPPARPVAPARPAPPARPVPPPRPSARLATSRPSCTYCTAWLLAAGKLIAGIQLRMNPPGRRGSRTIAAPAAPAERRPAGASGQVELAVARAADECPPPPGREHQRRAVGVL